jgi:hypothetical protein
LEQAQRTACCKSVTNLAIQSEILKKLKYNSSNKVNTEQVVSMKKRTYSAAIAFIMLFSTPGFTADLVVVLDRSGSIRANMPVIKEYVRKSIFAKVAEDDDIVHLLAFAGRFHHVGELRGDAKTSEIMALLESVEANGQFTDLTRAVESMTTYIRMHTAPNSRKVIFFLTDGVNDPPHDSPYREGLKHRFFVESEKSVQDGGWQVFVTGIGSETDAPQVSSLIGAQYIELSAKPSLEEFDRSITSRLRKARGSFPWWILGVVVGLLAGGGTAWYFLWYRRY